MSEKLQLSKRESIPQRINTVHTFGARALAAYNREQEDVLSRAEKKETDSTRGEWVEYGPGDINQLTEAAQGTPWMFKDRKVADVYFRLGAYRKDAEDNDYRVEDSQARFYLFHEYDEDGRIADKASAAIRLDAHGVVDEIDGAANEWYEVKDDILMDVVEKLIRLPKGKKFVQPLLNRRRINEMGKNMEAGGDISEEDIQFLWSLKYSEGLKVERPLEDFVVPNYKESPTFKRYDALRDKYDHNYANEHGFVISLTTTQDIKNNLPAFLKNDLDLSSNLLVYVLKQNYENNPQGLSDLIGEAGITTNRITDGTGDGHDLLDEIMQRIHNLKTFTYKSNTFLLPKDKWDEDKIAIPNTKNPTFLAPTNLTAVHNSTRIMEANGMEDQEFTEEEMLAVEKELLIPNGYQLPSDWHDIIEHVMQKTDGDIGYSYETKLCFALHNGLNMPSGSYWSNDRKASGFYHEILTLGDHSDVSLNDGYEQYNSHSIRCISEQKKPLLKGLSRFFKK